MHALVSLYYQLLFQSTFAYVVLASFWSRLSCLVTAKMEASGHMSDKLFDVFFNTESEQIFLVFGVH